MYVCLQHQKQVIDSTRSVHFLIAITVRKQQETINTLINTLESDSDTITSSEVSSDDNTESEASNGSDDDSIKSGELHRLDSTDVT